ncbi:hypothetical protein CMI39_00790 [Candidatus Pacearchaeota archaeon]|jgi:ubiquinone/menaquinone biosynthesis C-methylase UbiE|nr:hypothetical protein [Candidatus Pacearchaeota archaeon]|tara:strand:- start:42 stop:773 length:732 start_codon:yes stop_codon:yes gene_type:complete
MKINENRWNIAQESEKRYWEQFKTKSLLEYLEKEYKKDLDILLKKLEKTIKINKNTKILQIGCGPLDIINYFKKGKTYSIDPLANFYKKRFKIDYKSTHLKEAPGEQIPYKDNYFDLVIINNVLDHTKDPEKVLSETYRVLKKDGILHLEIQIYQKIFLLLTKIWGPLKKLFTREMFNIHHPHMFLSYDVEKIISKKFIVINKEYEDIEKLKEERKKQRFTLRFLALFKILGNINYRFVCKKK